jgi:hypothetical protein
MKTPGQVIEAYVRKGVPLSVFRVARATAFAVIPGRQRRRAGDRSWDALLVKGYRAAVRAWRRSEPARA